MNNIFLKCIILFLIGSISACKNNNKSEAEINQDTDIENVVISELDTNFVIENVTSLNNYDQIAQKFGIENIKKDTTIIAPEGKKINVSILYPATFQQMILYWDEKSHFSKLHSAEITCDSTGYKGKWQSKFGVKPGQTLQQIVALNQKAFTISGFGWDYAGHIISWEGGKLDNQKLTGSFSIYNKNRITEKQFSEIKGDTEFNVSLEAIVTLNPILNKLTVFCKK